MEESQVKLYKARLEEEEKKLAAQIAEYKKPVDFGSDVDSGDEESDETEESMNRLTIANDLHARLNSVRTALRKINEGKYGLCEKCGGEIEKDVLEIDPESRWCQKCKKSE